MNRVGLLVVIILFSVSAEVLGQNTSNRGKDFWVTYNGHVDGLASRLTLFLSTDQASNYEIFIGSTLISSGLINANTCLPVIIDPNLYSVYIDESDVIEPDKAIHVITTNPISLYSIISNSARTGGTMVLPSNTLGKEYYTFSYKNGGTTPSFAQFTIIATADNTTIEIIPTAPERNGKYVANQSFTKTLNKGETYQYQSSRDLDLSGSYIKSVDGCKPIAVFSGNTWAGFCEPGNNRIPAGGDNLYQQLFPVDSWGKKFVTAPFYNTLQGNTDVLRIIVAEDNTTITVNGSTTSANGSPLNNPYNKGSMVTFFSTTANVISGSNPISVARYQTSQTCNINNSPNINGPSNFPGDPEITVLNPVEQTLSNITVYSKLENVPTNINKYFLNVIIKTADANSFRLDGNPVTGFTAIDAEYSYVIIDVTNLQAQHRLTAIGGFSAIAYGYGHVESYAYLAGANIQDFTFQTSSAVTGDLITSGCLGEVIKLKINLPYKATKLIWDIQNGHGTITEESPVEIGTIPKDGVLYYTYAYPHDLQYNTANDYIFKVTATKPAADACGATEELITEFTVDVEPTAAFEVVPVGCQSAEIQFRDKSTSNSISRSISYWIWDFGDGTEPSHEQNPIHIYTEPNTYNVVLTVETNSKCGKTSLPFQIMINPKPLAKFEATANLCVNKNIVIDNLSSITGNGTITNYRWDFGDGNEPVNNADAMPPTFKYSTPGTKIIKLTVTSNLGCVSDVFTKEVIITDLPVADFTMPDVCFGDGITKFVNRSKNADGTSNGLTYEWNFGEAGSSTNTSTEQDGVHGFSAAGDFPIILKIKNTTDCEVSITKMFTVNGAVEKADFSIQNENNLCSNNDVVINNQSTVFFGKIIKIEIYKDYLNSPGSFETILYPANEDIHLTYSSFGGSSSRLFTIRLVAYSGETCTKEISKIITLKPTPQLEFLGISAICQNDGSVVINQARETSGITGNGIYSGKGLDASGNFNPKVAGVGIHNITYTFTVDNKCTSSITKSIEVYQSPVVDAGPPIYILAGGQATIPATAEGENLTYQWTPALGLNNDEILNPVASPEKDTNYTLTVTTQSNGCSATSKVTVSVLQTLDPPNSFTPNGDNVNDVWNIKYLDTYPNVTVEVFNRNGSRVFLSNGYKAPFDGNYQNESLPVGVYYYVINPGNGRKTLTGPLTIIR